MARKDFIKVRTTPEERAAYLAMAARRGTDLSALIRAHLERLRKREGSKASADAGQ
jgi:hypothetical protein